MSTDEDLCTWFDGSRRSYLMDWSFKRIEKFVQHDRPLKCPLRGNIAIKVSNVSLNEYFPAVPLLPSGRYRMEANFTGKNRNTLISGGRLFSAISDHRIEQY